MIFLMFSVIAKLQQMQQRFSNVRLAQVELGPGGRQLPAQVDASSRPRWTPAPGPGGRQLPAQVDASARSRWTPAPGPGGRQRPAQVDASSRQSSDTYREPAQHCNTMVRSDVLALHPTLDVCLALTLTPDNVT